MIAWWHTLSLFGQCYIGGALGALGMMIVIFLVLWITGAYD